MSGGFQWDDKSDKNYMSTVAPGAEMWSKPVTFSDRIGDFFHGLGMNRERATKLGGAFGFLPDAAYESGQTLAGKHGGAWAAGEAATYTPAGAVAKGAALAKPLMQSMFLTLPMVRALESAKMRPKNLPGAFGTSKSYENYSRVAPFSADNSTVQPWIEQNWQRTGWAPPEAWGKSWGPSAYEPFAWHHMPDIYVKPGNHSGPLKDVLQGDDLDALFTAAPDIKDFPITTSTSYMNSPRGEVSLNIIDPRLWSAKDMTVLGGNADEANGILKHELQHLLDLKADHKNIDASGAMLTVPGTKAELAAAAHRDANISDEYFDSFPYNRVIDGIRKHSGYLNTPHEVRAREAARRYRYDMPAITMPGLQGGADPFAADALWPSWNPQEWDMLGIDMSMMKR